MLALIPPTPTSRRQLGPSHIFWSWRRCTCRTEPARVWVRGVLLVNLRAARRARRHHGGVPLPPHAHVLRRIIHSCAPSSTASAPDCSTFPSRWASYSSRPYHQSHLSRTTPLAGRTRPSVAPVGALHAAVQCAASVLETGQGGRPGADERDHVPALVRRHPAGHHTPWGRRPLAQR